ncbi:MAG: DNA polymerase I [Candidatus Nanopelagicales bacterium]|nr:DNA polymerase I [Candidatus Nanopelagicales bacterium]MBL6834605.1 DNA polymerase I [Candidatus Nanopelagicales bacterium]
MADPERLLVLDGHSLAYRAFYALPVENFSTSTGQPTNAVYGFTSMLVNLLRDEEPSHVAVAFDVSRRSFRTERFPDYKATRSASPEGFKGQIELIKEVVRAFGVNWLELEGFEADDIIATLATQAAARGLTVGIVSGDRDTFQLVDERTTVLYPRKGVSDLARMTPEAIVEKYGLNPGQYADFAALRGDPSDNLPGIPGVGEKTAVKWLNAYSDLAGLIDHVDEVSGKVGDALRGAVPQVLVNRELTELVRDVPVAVDLDSLQWREWSRTSVGELFDSLQFAALRSRVESLPHGTGGDDSYDNRGHDEPPAMDIEIREAGAVPQVLAGVTVGAMAFRGTWAAGRGVIDAVAVCDGTSVVVMPLGGDEDRDALHAWLMDSSVDKRIHDVKGPDLALLTHTGGDAVIEGVSVDTALAAYLDSPGARSYALEDVATRLLGRTLDDQHDSGQLAFDGGGEEELHGLGTQARAVHDIAEVVQERLKDENIYSLLAEMEIPLAGLLARMEYAGIAVDRAGLQGLSEEFGATMREAENAAHQIVGRTFNLGSPKQLQEVLFVDRGLPKTKKIKTGYTTDAEALQNLFATTQDPVLEQLLAWRDVSKLRQTVEGLLPLVDDHGRTHTTFRQTAAATGRLSSSDPNLQNIPIRTEAGRRIRGCFIVGDGFESLMTADYSQIEMRIMADASGDDGLIEAFLDGEDLHNFVAARVFGVDESDVDPEMRRRIKAMSYGLAYGLSAFGLAQQLRISPNEAQDLMDEYFTRFGGVRDYLAGVVDEARKRGYTETMFGRRRYLPDLNHDNRQRREMAERMALNAPIQGTAADIVKVAMLNVDRALTERSLGSRMLLQVHDELVIEVAPGEAQEVEELVRSQMGAAAKLRVPLDVSVGRGSNWQAAGH